MASGEAKPLTRREARALQEAQQKEAKRRGAKPAAQEPEAVGPQPEIEPVPAAPGAAVDSQQAKERAKAAFTAEDRSPVPPEELKVEGPAEHPPVSETTDLAESGEPDAARAAVPTELLVGAPAEPKKSRAGRNLPAAIGVGLVMLGLVLAGLFLFEPLLVALIVVLAGVGSWEVARATTHAKTSVPLVPLFLASAMLPVSAIWGGLEAVGFTYMICLVIALLVRLTEGLKGAAASVMSSVFIISWVPLLLSFALLILEEPNGQWLIATILLLAVSNDTFGYIVGVLFGKHPMAPKISPKKSWEGFAGSMLGSMAVGALAMHFWLDMPWWTGVILAFFTTIAATTGDFSESMIKRELGIKDMSNLLPGHGGIMDRLDSVVFVVPLGYLISHLLTWSVSLQ
ncbi:phosphatidate cytidylyltransferase [Glutamicibacter protophormiae]|uniref:phosphatidate cytidylyltransferase n=1 Tax=Glutamicibacter protophormiae TaxID=37930 RepID=UPI001EF47F7A|nr:phosphatidate cytidylyltransferase [Glutamicibacter protophormiae]